MRQVKIIIEKHSDGYVAYPLGLKGVVVKSHGSADAVSFSHALSRAATEVEHGLLGLITTEIERLHAEGLLVPQKTVPEVVAS